jgi:hypothetical protein
MSESSTRFLTSSEETRRYLRNHRSRCVNRLSTCVASVLLVSALPFTGIALRPFSHGHYSNYSVKPPPTLNGSVRVNAPDTNQDPAKKPQPDVVPQSVQTRELEHMRKTNRQLAAEVERLRKKVADLENDRSLNSIHDRISKEEQRAESLQTQLLAIAEKEAVLQTRKDQVTEQLRPENIANLSIAGSLHPEELRESTRRSLTNEMHRIDGQVDLLHQSRTRLQTSLSHVDSDLLHLRSKLN